MPQRAKHTQQQQQQQTNNGTAAAFAVHGQAASSPTAAAAAAFDAEVQRQRTDSQHEAAAQSLNGSHGAGVLGFMRRARSSTAGDGEATGRAGDESLPSAPLRMDRRGSVEAEVPSHSDEEDDDDEQEDPLHTKNIAIARAQSPENAHGAELECALLNQAAAAAAAAADSTNATATSVPASASNAGSLVHPHGGISVGDFELLKVVGRGAYGKVFLCRKHSSGRLYAMKVVAKSEAIRKNVVANMKAERDVLKAVRHPFIVNLRYAFQTPSKLYLVLDYIGGGELFNRLNASKDHALSVKEARFYAAEMVLALEHLHANNIVYRDLKPENILLQKDGHLCLTDFGFAKENISEAGSGTLSFCGTLHYMAPEMIEYAGHGKGSDWWALGALLFEMLTGSTPFNGSNRKAIQQNILTAPLKIPKWCDAPTKSVLTELLRRPIAKRLGCGPTGVAAIKRHAFFHGVDWAALAAKKVPPPFVPSMEGPCDTSNFDTRFTVERAVDTPVSPSQMALVLQTHGISQTQFGEADATFANFHYMRDNTPGASPALRAMVGAEMMRRQGSAGAMGSPRAMGGAPPSHPVHNHFPDTLELPPARPSASAVAAVAAATAAATATATAAAPVDPSAWPVVDPAVLQQQREQAAAKTAQRKAAVAAAATAAAAASPVVVPVAATQVAVQRPKAVKATPSPPPDVAQTVAASAVAPTAATNGHVHVAAPSAPNHSSKQPAARQQPPKQGKQPQQPNHAAATEAHAAAARPASHGWQAKSPAAVAPTATPAAPVANSSMGIRVLSGIKQLAPSNAAVTPADSAAAAPAPTAAPSSASTPAPAPALKKLSAAASVFVPGVGLVPSARPAASVAPAPAASLSKQPPRAAPVATLPVASLSHTTAAAPSVASARAPASAPPAVVAASTAVAVAAAAKNPLGPARWGIKAAASN